MKFYSAFFFFLMSLISSTQGQQVNCIFENTGHFGYVCRFVNVNVTDPKKQFVIGGVHIPGRTDRDVVTILLQTSVFNYFPQQIFDRFQNISFLNMESYQLMEFHQPWRNCDHLTSMTIRSNRLQRIPGRIFAACTNLDRLWIGHESHLTEIDDQAFVGLSRLRNLNLDDLQAFSELRGEMFQELPSLTTFTMTRTNVQQLSTNIFRSLRSLVVVDISNNQLTTIQSGAFNDLLMLESININRNVNLKNIETEAFVGLPVLRFLYFERGNLTELRTNSFSVFPNLELLDIGSNGLAKVERTFFDNFANLQRLRVDGNECIDDFVDNIRNQRQELYRRMEECFQRFDTSQTTVAANCIFEDSFVFGYVCRFVNVNFLNPNQQFVIGGVHLPGRTDNHVVEILTENCIFNYYPLQIFDRFQHLRFADLNFIHLTELHQPWRNCGNLFQIFIRGNRLQRIPGRIFAACTNVAHFWIGDESNLTEIDDQAFAGMPSLRTLDIHFLQISELRAEMFQATPSLTFFSMSGTNIQQLPSDTFKSLRSLMVVEIMDTQLDTIQSGTFNDFPFLHSINIIRNVRLSNIEPNAFVGLPSLWVLNLNSGNLTELRTNSFTVFPRIEILDIGSNGLAKVERNFFDNFPFFQRLYASQGNECVNDNLNNIQNQRQELYRVMEECFQRFDASQTPNPPATTTTTEPTTPEQQATCIFEDLVLIGYVCRFVNANITNPNEQFVIGGVHLPGKSDSDVVKIKTENSVFNYFPQQIFDRFPNIRSVDFASTELRELHQPWRNCDNLLQITFRGNKLQRIPGRIFAACTNVDDFWIENEIHLTEIDDQAFAGMSSLIHLQIMNIQGLSQLRAEMIQEIPSLEYFGMIGTNVQELSSNTFRSHRSLMVVEISNNQLNTIHSRAFNDMPMLQVIIIGNSHLTNIQPEAFVGLPSLWGLSFHSGNLSELRTNSFSVFPVLELFIIHSNGLAKVERNFFDNFPNLQILHATQGNECVNETLTNINDQRQELYRVMEECFNRFDASQTTIPPTTSTEAPTTTEETTTLGASTITLSLGLVLSCVLIIKTSW